tara:strand:- start:852 stop:1115 length:264 start_codon:yes stop_codon:yes gene_type:complete
MTRFKPQKKQEYNAQINLDVLDVNAQKMLQLILPTRKNVILVQMLNGGKSGQRKRTAVIQRPDYRISSFFFRGGSDTSCYNNNFASY